MRTPRAVRVLLTATSLLVGAATAAGAEEFIREFPVADMGIDGVVVGSDGYVYVHGWDLSPPVNVNYSVYLGKATLTGTSIRRSGVLGFGVIAAKRDGTIGIATSDKVQYAHPTFAPAGGILGTSSQFPAPPALAFDAAGRAFISSSLADNQNGRIVVFNNDGSFAYNIVSMVIESPGCGTVRIAPRTMAFGPEGMLWAGYAGSGLCGYRGFIAKLDPNSGNLIGGFNPDTPDASFGTPTGLVLANGVLYVSDATRNDVRAYDPNSTAITGTLLRTVLPQGGGRAPRQLAADCRGRLVIADEARARVIVMGDPADQTPCGPGTFGEPVPPGGGGGGTNPPPGGGSPGLDTGATVAFPTAPSTLRQFVKRGLSVTVKCLSCSARAEVRIGTRVIAVARMTPGRSGTVRLVLKPNAAGKRFLRGKRKAVLTLRIVTVIGAAQSTQTTRLTIRRP